MKKTISVLVITMATFSSISGSAFGSSGPIPLPKQIRVESASPRKKVWDTLTEKQRKLAFHLTQAGQLGRALLTYQLHRHGLEIRSLFQNSLSQHHLAETKKLLGKDGFHEYLLLAAKFFDMGGIYANSNRKFILTHVPAAKLESLTHKHLPKIDKVASQEIIRLLTDPEYEVQLFPENQDGTGLELTGGNLYEKGISGKEVKDSLDKTLKTTLNTRVIRNGSALATEVLTTKTPGIVGKTLQKIVAELEAAKPFADSDHQLNQINFMIQYFNDGNVENFRKANIEWVKDGSNSPVDFMIGWVEVYEDWLARIGSWESYVQIVDPQVTRIAQALATHAQYFEDQMPYGKYKKTFPANYSPPAIMVFYFQELANYRSGGYNLPNFDDIRRDYGAKNVIRLPLPGESEDPQIRETYHEMLQEFMSASKIEKTLTEREKMVRVLVLLHEIIGHGSGTYDTSKFGKNEDPISALGNLGSALEEQRADLTALVFAGDPKLVEVGIYQTADEAKETLHIMYDYYIADFLRRTSGQRTFAEAHQRGHLLFINALLEAGAIAWENRNGTAAHTDDNGVLVVKDYDKFHTVAVQQLGELQRIKANRDGDGLKNIFAKYAPLDEINKPWAQAVVKRGGDLKINAGYVEQPWRIDGSYNFVTLGGTTLESIAPFWEDIP